MEASGYLDLGELARVVLHGAHDLVTEFLFIVIPQQIFALKKHKTKKTFCYQTIGMFDIAQTAERASSLSTWGDNTNTHCCVPTTDPETTFICLLISRLSPLHNQTADQCVQSLNAGQPASIKLRPSEGRSGDFQDWYSVTPC